MVEVQGFVWDDWNKEHLNRHRVTIELAIVLSPEDRNLKPYGNGIYYVVTAFEKEVEL